MSDIVPYISPRPLRGTRALAGYRLGALGTSPLVGTVVSKGAALGVGIGVSSLIGTAAGTAGGALLGAAAGSVVPVIGTVIGAVVGILTSKLFGHANYAQVYSVIDNVRTLWNAYAGVAGQYVGRQYGWPELQQILHGGMVSGLFTGNGPAPGVVCTQAMISKNIHACGVGEWIDDLIGVGPASGDQSPNNPHPGSGTNNMLNLIGTGLSQGVKDPITMADKVLVPGMEAIAATKGNSWASVARSQNPALYRQYLIDLSDFIMSQQDPNLPAYYGSVGIQPVGAAPAPQQTSQPPAQSYSGPLPGACYNAQGLQMTCPPTNQPAVIPPPISAPTALPPLNIVTGTGQTIVPPTSIPMNPTPPTIAAQGGVTAPVDATAAYLAQLQQQGATQNQAMLAAIQQLQSQGMSAQAAQSTVAAAAPYTGIPPQIAAPVTPQANPVTAGLSSNSSLLIAGMLGVVAVIFATARPKGRRR